jgi:hypothetical protein
MIPEKFKLDDEQTRVIKSMGLYWTEISKRDDETGSKEIATNELYNLMSVLSPIQILLIVNELAVNQYPKRGVIKKGWEKEGTEITVLGPAIELRGMKWTPIIFDKEEDPSWQKTSSIKIL